MKIAVLWDPTPCTLVDTYQGFVGRGCSVFDVELTMKKEAINSFESLFSIYQATRRHVQEVSSLNSYSTFGLISERNS
jgi:hypothetical protein